MKKALIYFSLLFSHSLFAQLPNTDIWLMDIKTGKDTIILTNPINITNRTGYDNQPSFSPDGKYILYTSIRDEKQSDIYKYDLKTKQIIQFINTPKTSEYSPTFMPDGKNISVVMVEPDSIQRLWKFPIKGGEPGLIIKDIDSIGYHCWINKDSLALIMITEPPNLEIVNIKTEQHKTIANNTGRCMAIYSNGTLAYVQKIDSAFRLTSFCPNPKECKRNYYSIPNEDFAFIQMKEPVFLTGVKTKIYASYLFQGIDKFIFDLKDFNIKNITRIAVSPDGKKLAFVAESK